MKTNYLMLIVIVFIISSCAPFKYYQVYKIQADENIKQTQDSFLYFENEEIKIIYNFNSEGGNIGFKIQNKIDSMLYLNLDECFFVKNGIAFDYYQNKTTQYNNVSYKQKKTICIPSNTSKYISEYFIWPNIYKDCYLLQFPYKEQDIKTKTFTDSTTPYLFSNILSYKIGKTGLNKHIENSFYVKSITNVPDKYFFKGVYDDICGEKSIIKSYYPKYNSGDEFYIIYEKTERTSSHFTNK